MHGPADPNVDGTLRNLLAARADTSTQRANAVGALSPALSNSCASSNAGCERPAQPAAAPPLARTHIKARRLHGRRQRPCALGSRMLKTGQHTKRAHIHRKKAAATSASMLLQAGTPCPVSLFAHETATAPKAATPLPMSSPCPSPLPPFADHQPVTDPRLTARS